MPFKLWPAARIRAAAVCRRTWVPMDSVLPRGRGVRPAEDAADQGMGHGGADRARCAARRGGGRSTDGPAARGDRR